MSRAALHLGVSLFWLPLALRNSYGIAFAPDGRLLATEHGMDERGGRYVSHDLDDFYEIENGRWYGWPDFASGVRLDDPSWGEGGQGREPVLATFPEESPPKPVLSFDPHAGANGVSFSPGGSFGFGGDAFVALFGDLAPVTTPRLASPRGNKVVRVDVRARRVVDFAVNKIQGPASKLPHDVFDRYPPPFELEADMLFGFGVAGEPMLVWFSRITRGLSGDGRVEAGTLYHELNVMAARADGSFFAPAIWATSRRSVRIGWKYGMPKEPIVMSFDARGGVVEARAGRSFARARLMPGGAALGALAELLLPVRSPPVRFPSGGAVRAEILSAPRLHVARLAGSLSAQESRLARPLRLLPLGLYAPGLVMRLPPPGV